MGTSFEEKVAQAMAEVSSLSPQQANELKQNNPDTLFIDPRDPEDIASTTGIIPGAINVTLNRLDNESVDELPTELKSQKQRIVTACQGGPMGALAAHALKRLGFTNVAFVENGTQGWLDAGYSTIR